MDQFTLNLIFVGGSFLVYIAIAIWARAASTSEFYAAGRSVNSTRWPLCKPTPTARVTVLRVRCSSMAQL